MASIRSHSQAFGPAAPQFEPIPAGGRSGSASCRQAKLAHAALSNAGLVRPHNEDRWQAAAEDGLFVVSDGMGGYNAGEIAAELAVRTACQLIPELVATGEDIAAAMHHALDACNDRIRECAAGNRDCLGMGTTIVGCLIRGDRLHVAHIGDSRAYLLRDGHLQRMTRDHSIGQQIADSGALTEAQVRHLPGRGILTRALGVEESVPSDCGVFDWRPEDTLLLCSDGLTDLVPDERIEQVLLACAGPGEQVRALVDAAMQAGGSDNVTALVVSANLQAQEEDRDSGAQNPMH
jgi:protein phosphatase